MLDDRNGFAYANGCSTCAMGFESRFCKMTKTFDTCDSHVVPHRSTEQAQWCLTSEFGWDPVLSPWYDRMIWMDDVGLMGVGRGGGVPRKHNANEDLTR